MKVKDKQIKEILALTGQAQAAFDSEEAYLRQLLAQDVSKISSIYRAHVEIRANRRGQLTAYKKVVEILGLLEA